jgi:carboxyl-terminal processing protease
MAVPREADTVFPFCLFKVIFVRLNKRRNLMFLVWLVGLLFAAFGCNDAVSIRPEPVAAPAEALTKAGDSIEQLPPAQKPELSVSEPAVEDELAERRLDESRPFDKQSELTVARPILYDILRGDFNSAEQKLSQVNPAGSVWLGRLTEIIRQYRLIEERRLADRQKAYEKQLTKFMEIRDAPDTNEANDIASALLVIAKASKLAPPGTAEKERLLNEPFAKQCIDKAIQQASEYESQGQWSKAYVECYSLLSHIYENSDYSNHADELLDKIMIKASLQNSPCETRQQRYEGISRNMFIRALRVVDLSHVAMLDYGLMASKAMRRCELLGEILLFSETFVESDLSRPDPQAVSAWLAALQAVDAEIQTSVAGISKDNLIDVFNKVLSLNAVTIALPEEVVIFHFADAALQAMDPHTNLIWPYQVKDFQKDMTQEFSGIGIEIRKEADLLKAVSLLPDTPAYHSGLDAGDIIEAVDGLSTEHMSLHCAVQKITGPKGTKVTLTVKRPGQETSKEITIVRDTIIVPTIRGWQRTATGQWRYSIDQDRQIGYVRITSFVERTSDDLEEVLKQLESAGVKALILDLRFNTGGQLTSAVDVSDKFLADGIIVSTRPRYGVPIWETAHKKGTHPNYPLIILINEQSASASEIVAGALQDPVHKRAILVGTKTYGKGSVQTIIDYPGGGSQLKYTTAYYHLPSGQRVLSREEAKKEGTEDWGILPDVKVEMRDDELQKMFEVQRDNDILVKADHDIQANPLSKSTLEQTLEADPQLAIAALIARTKLIEHETCLMTVKIDKTMEDAGGEYSLCAFFSN